MSVLLEAVEITIGGDAPEGVLLVSAPLYYGTHAGVVRRNTTSAGDRWSWGFWDIHEGGLTLLCELISGSSFPVVVAGTSTARLTYSTSSPPGSDTITVAIDGIERAVYALIYPVVGWSVLGATVEDTTTCWVSIWARALAGDERVWNLQSVRDWHEWNCYIDGNYKFNGYLYAAMVQRHGGSTLNAAPGLPVWLYRSETTELTEVTL